MFNSCFLDEIGRNKRYKLVGHFHELRHLIVTFKSYFFYVEMNMQLYYYIYEETRNMRINKWGIKTRKER